MIRQREAPEFKLTEADVTVSQQVTREGDLKDNPRHRWESSCRLESQCDLSEQQSLPNQS